jgi:hypothetical protein
LTNSRGIIFSEKWTCGDASNIAKGFGWEGSWGIAKYRVRHAGGYWVIEGVGGGNDILYISIYSPPECPGLHVT